MYAYEENCKSYFVAMQAPYFQPLFLYPSLTKGLREKLSKLCIMLWCWVLTRIVEAVLTVADLNPFLSLQIEENQSSELCMSAWLTDQD